MKQSVVPGLQEWYVVYIKVMLVSQLNDIYDVYLGGVHTQYNN